MSPKDMEALAQETGQGTAAREIYLEAVASGTLVENLVSPDESVNEGQTLLVFKTLNIELLIPSPITGKVLQLNYETGSNVEKGNCLVTISTNPKPIDPA